METIKAAELLNLKIEQRGCEDIYAKFNFTFKGKKNHGLKRNLRQAAQVLKNLKISSAAILSFEIIHKIANIALKESKKAKPFKNDVVCLSQSEFECLTDFSFTYKYPHLQFFYIDRP